MLLWLLLFTAATLACTPAITAADATPGFGRAPSDDGRTDWIIVWKRDVDGQRMSDHLCPVLRVNDPPDDAPPSPLPPPAIAPLLPDLGIAPIACTARFDTLVNGLAGRFTNKELDQVKLAFKPYIDFIVRDKPIALDLPAGTDQGAFRRALLASLQANATWGLSSLESPSLPLQAGYRYSSNGSGVHVYVLDTGIRTTHDEFKKPDGGSRALPGFDAVMPGGDASMDCHGHGTHVAAVIGGNTFGVAKNVTLHAVRVLDCNGRAMVSSMLKGLEWVGSNHQSPAVVHMSIEGSYSTLVNKATDQLIQSFLLPVVVSSGNSGVDACRVSPASTPAAVTVAAHDSDWQRWSWANWGACVDIFGPGVNILSAVSVSDSSTGLKTGTSMAAPFVTGVVATYLERNPGASAEEVLQHLVAASLKSVIKDDPRGYATLFPGLNPDLLDISSTPNRLLHTLDDKVHLTPSTVEISTGQAGNFSMDLSFQAPPQADVVVNASVPAGWDGSPLAVIDPSSLVIGNASWNQTHELQANVQGASQGNYQITLTLTSDAPAYNGVIKAVKVVDHRPLSGDTAGSARVIPRLPFRDSGSTSVFHDTYGCSASDQSPDVVYVYTPPVDMQVVITTCGSSFDTKLLLATNLSDPATYACNDDDRDCTTNTANSRLDASFTASASYYIVVDGYMGSAGAYVLSIVCTTCTPADGGALQRAQAAADATGAPAAAASPAPAQPSGVSANEGGPGGIGPGSSPVGRVASSAAPPTPGEADSAPPLAAPSPSPDAATPPVDSAYPGWRGPSGSPTPRPSLLTAFSGPAAAPVTAVSALLSARGGPRDGSRLWSMGVASSDELALAAASGFFQGQQLVTVPASTRGCDAQQQQQPAAQPPQQQQPQQQDGGGAVDGEDFAQVCGLDQQGSCRAQDAPQPLDGAPPEGSSSFGGGD